ncbi:MaoC/PaaZ C-terminal domain-containing protein [uncultured Bradyrhizobium sp.]|uniref:MaoC/PaaZ C-terminal domain-containing protein n=1 Tax=uncultured Bradyrhizobium sp. TaxID=199684 RepID=UPI0035CC2564
MVPKFADDFSVGAKFSIGEYRISASDIIDFATKFDPQPYHTSASAAEKSVFRGLVASGWHSAAIWMRLYVDHMLTDAAVEGSPGVDELRWRAPVRPDDVLTGSVEVIELKHSAFRRDIVTVFKKGALHRPGDAGPVLSLILQSRYRTRPIPSTEL